ncbi:Haloacid dehalogenase-like hydrolase domain-containing 5 [Hondaea fermentalgiana]|uniref:Haloacid dehalogenase-like hydrolase domain-containing 5 n=1 Tax=Hondaea fermentalgiana TaxID=2315210 RepID=A0A2R5GVK3_9STRA|nr:Haloacid dehalogenase-like hydrolase domain-containing 5 [Hondaea fermentalgiana]|eukprot:GBG34867.1 Haloacid dehalogenase-like hydrolase domain-containing 5 [Hondaea fermentalgiana]
MLRGAPSRVGVCFDIDGVLVRGKEVLAGAREAVQKLRSVGVPYVFLTNGGGHLESVRARRLSDRLEVPVDPAQVVLAHSPMQQLVPEFGKKRVMILGCREEVDVAKAYGFERVTTPQAFHALHPELYSFRAASPHPHDDHHEDPIEALVVMHDPADWHIEVQVCLDILLGRDPVRMSSGEPEVDPTHRTQVVPLYNSNDDFIYASSYPHPRLAQGAFIETLSALFRKTTGGTSELKVNRFGKPHVVTFDFARKILEKQHDGPLERIFMIGDNPDADVAGANNAGDPFRSVLLETGVFKQGQDTNNADFVVPGVWDAIEQLVLPLHEELSKAGSSSSTK